MGFKTDKQKGDHGEDLCIKLLEKNKFKCEKNRGTKQDLVGWDFKFRIPKSTIEILCEVKNDLMASKTGNLAIEYHNPKLNKPSGLEATKAYLWFYILDNTQIWVGRVNEIKQFIIDNKPCKKIKVGGDQNASLYIYKKERVLGEIFDRIDNLKKISSKLLLKGY